MLDNETECIFVVVSNFVCTVCQFARQVRDSVQWIYSEPMLIYYIQLFRDAYWPNGQLSAATDLPTDSQKLQMRRQAKLALLRNIPGWSCNVCRRKLMSGLHAQL